MNHHTDFVLHPIVRVRLIDASPRETALVRRQLGPLEAEVRGEADIRIRFVDKMRLDSPLRYLGDAEFAYDENAFFVLRGKHKSRVMVQMPMDEIGGPLEIVCCRGVAAIPYLIALINLTALAKGYLPLHASAIRYQQRDILITGWAKGGKTETVLGYANQGASYIGDEWIYLSGDGQEMVGIPEPIRLWDWHLRGLPRLRQRLTRKEKMRLEALRVISAVVRTAGRGSSLMRRVGGILHRQRYVQVPPGRLFRDACCERGRPDALFFVVSWDSEEYTVRPIEIEQVVSRMRFSLLDELADVMACYLRYRFAFPDRGCPLLDMLPELLDRRLAEVLHDIPSYLALHPYPVSPQAMFDATESFALQSRRAPCVAARLEPAAAAEDSCDQKVRI